MRGGILLVAISLAPALHATDDQVQQMLARVAEEAEVFRSVAPKVVGQETLRQKVLKHARRFRPRIGAPKVKAPELQYSTRKVVSEYTYSTFDASPNVLHEFREVTSVDGRDVSSPEKARQTLAMGMISRDDRLKKRMLETFEKNGLVGAATDFGQVILLFGKRRLDDYSFQFAGKSRLGDQDVLGVMFRQIEGKEGITIFEGHKVVRRPLQGTLWVRASDFLPVRIDLSAMRDEGGNTVVDEATVEYAMSKHGVLLPTSVVQRQSVAGQLVVENNFEYADFRMFSAQTDVQFKPVPAEPPKK